jgi:hypothetical protein
MKVERGETHDGYDVSFGICVSLSSFISAYLNLIRLLFVKGNYDHV